MFHVEQKQLKEYRVLIFDQQRNPVKLFFGIFTALAPYMGSDTSEFYLVLFIKLLVILYCFGLVKAYKFDSYNNNKTLYRFLNITVYQNPLHFSDFEYISIFTASAGLGYCLNIFKGKKRFQVYKSSFYEDALFKGKELSRVLNIELYNPLE